MSIGFHSAASMSSGESELSFSIVDSADVQPTAQPQPPAGAPAQRPDQWFRFNEPQAAFAPRGGPAQTAQPSFADPDGAAQRAEVFTTTLATPRSTATRQWTRS